jgi:hypothetical protein
LLLLRESEREAARQAAEDAHPIAPEEPHLKSKMIDAPQSPDTPKEA